MFRSRILVAALFVATTASAHIIVDVAMSLSAPRFVPMQQSFTYRVIADDLNHDSGFGLVITTVLPPPVKFSAVSGSKDRRCIESNLPVTSAAEPSTPDPDP